MTETTDKFLTRREASDYLTGRYALGTFTHLQKLACIGGGPVFTKIGSRVRYRRADLDAWIASRSKRMAACGVEAAE